jgi:hypothetical protein
LAAVELRRVKTLELLTQTIGDQESHYPISAMADDSGVFEMVAELPNVTPAANKELQAVKGQPILFLGYFRVWNEGEDRGPAAPSNPHPALELRPAWGIESGSIKFTNPAVTFSMQQYQGYGVNKFGPPLA